jgi:hypothetical protein
VGRQLCLGRGRHQCLPKVNPALASRVSYLTTGFCDRQSLAFQLAGASTPADAERPGRSFCLEGRGWGAHKLRRCRNAHHFTLEVDEGGVVGIRPEPAAIARRHGGQTRRAPGLM